MYSPTLGRLCELRGLLCTPLGCMDVVVAIGFSPKSETPAIFFFFRLHLNVLLGSDFSGKNHENKIFFLISS